VRTAFCWVIKQQPIIAQFLDMVTTVTGMLLQISHKLLLVLMLLYCILL